MAQYKSQTQEGIDYLNALEKTGKYVFHGSPFSDISILEPRQATHIPDRNKPEEIIDDGEPAVSATPYIDFATFRALVNSHNLKGKIARSGFGFKDGKKEFFISNKEALALLEDKSGYVYVFDKADFEPYSRNGVASQTNMEWRSYKEVKPVEVVLVKFKDIEHILPSIEFLEK